MLRPRVVHACDLDTIIPSFIYAKLFRRIIIFDMFDRYAMLNIPTKFRLLFHLVNSVEEYFSHHVSFMITIGEWVLDTFNEKPKECLIIANYSEDRPLNTLMRNEDDASLVYIGPIRKNRALVEISEIIKDLDKVKFIIAGRPLDEDIFNKLMKNPKVHYKGMLSPDEAISILASGSIAIALYELENPQRISSHSTLVFVQGGMIVYDLEKSDEVFASPQKLFESMACGIPVITNVATKVIKETNCGIVVNYNNLDDIKNAILHLISNHEIRQKLGENGRSAFLKKYNWTNMETRLLDFYFGILCRNEVNIQ